MREEGLGEKLGVQTPRGKQEKRCRRESLWPEQSRRKDQNHLTILLWLKRVRLGWRSK
jgi:hypothetical protein